MRLAAAIRQNQSVLCLFLVLLTSYFTYFFNYQNPQAFYWDENYHVASAQKYLNGVYFMEPHPPLGKMLIALGEKIIDANPQDDQFIKTDYAQDPPSGFSFTGYRFFPALLAWLTAPLLFGLFLLLTRNPVWAMLLSSFYTFDTAQIVHGRGAMLETAMLFFAIVALTGIVLLRRRTDSRGVMLAGLLFGAGFACALATKVFSLVLILLAPAAVLLLWKKKKMIGLFLGVSAVSFLIPYAIIWQAHFSIGSTVVPDLPDAGFYQASEQYKKILTDGTSGNFLHFPVMLRDSLAFVGHYQNGVPRLDLCKSDENGSPWFMWPIGGRTINYRWATGGGHTYRYLSLVSNPVAWLGVLFGVFMACALLFTFIFAGGKKLKEPVLLLTFLALYFGFMVAVSQITRVMYLYHYFMPLTFGYVLFTIAFLELTNVGKFEFTQQRKTWTLLGLNVLLFASFQYLRPLAYYEPLRDTEVAERNIFKLWELRCARCGLDSSIVVRPTSD